MHLLSSAATIEGAHVSSKVVSAKPGMMIVEVTARNPTDRLVVAKAAVVGMVRPSQSMMARMVRPPFEATREEVAFKLKPGETLVTRVTLASKKLPGPLPKKKIDLRKPNMVTPATAYVAIAPAAPIKAKAKAKLAFR